MVVDLLFQEEYGTRKSYIGELSREGNGSRARACRKARSLAISTVTGGEISGGKVGNFQAEKTDVKRKPTLNDEYSCGVVCFVLVSTERGHLQQRLSLVAF